MQLILNWLIGLGPWNWLRLSVALFILETTAPGVYFIWFGMAALMVGALALYIDIAWQWQLVLFGSIAMISVLFFRYYSILWRPSQHEPQLNDRGAYYVGRVVEIKEAIIAGRGRARVGDSLWSVEGPDMPAGARARVVATKGTVLIVEAHTP